MINLCEYCYLYLYINFSWHIGSDEITGLI